LKIWKFEDMGMNFQFSVFKPINYNDYFKKSF